MRIRTTRLLTFLLLISIEGLCQDFPSMAAIHDYDPGDEFHRIHFYCCNELSFQMEQCIIKERIHDGEGLRYVVSRNLYDYLSTVPPLLVDTTLFGKTDTLKVADPDSVIFGNSDSSFVMDGMYNGRMVHAHTYWVLNTLKVEWYVEGCGMVYNAWRVPPSAGCDVVDSLIYFKKGTESWGHTLLSGSREICAGQFMVYPNPAEDIIVFQAADPQHLILGVEICNASGNQIFQVSRGGSGTPVKVSFDAALLVPGVYFAYIRTPEGYVVKKFIKR